MILDSITPIRVADVGSLTNELNALRRLADGMSYLYGQVRTWELNISEAIPKNIRVFSFGNDPRMRGVPRDRIECHFHWYAVSLLNLVRLVSYIAYGRNTRKRLRYEKPVLGAVLSFRHKIGAHIAVASFEKRPEDTPAVLLMSVLPQITWDDDLSQLAVRMTRGKDSFTSGNVMKPWRLTEVHERLCDRYPLLAQYRPTFERADQCQLRN